MEIRWNTTFVMLDRFLQYRFILHGLNSQPFKIPHITPAQYKTISSKKFEFSNSDWRHITDLHTALKRFFVSTNIISAKHYPTLATANSGELHISAIQREEMFIVRIKETNTSFIL